MIDPSRTYEDADDDIETECEVCGVTGADHDEHIANLREDAADQAREFAKEDRYQ